MRLSELKKVAKGLTEDQLVYLVNAYFVQEVCRSLLDSEGKEEVRAMDITGIREEVCARAQDHIGEVFFEHKDLWKCAGIIEMSNKVKKTDVLK